MENKKETLENYKIREGEIFGGRIAGGIMGLVIGATSGERLVTKTLEVASKMYNHIQTNADFNFYNNLERFYDTYDKLEILGCGAGIVIGGAILSHSLFAPKYEIYKENKETLEKQNGK